MKLILVCLFGFINMPVSFAGNCSDHPIGYTFRVDNPEWNKCPGGLHRTEHCIVTVKCELIGNEVLAVLISTDRALIQSCCSERR